MTLPTCPDCTYADVREVWQAEPVEVLSIPCAKHSRFRDAATGQYVTAEHAATNPATTVREDDSRVRELQARLDAVLALHRPASEEMRYCLGCDDESSVFITEWPCPTYRAALGVE